MLWVMWSQTIFTKPPTSPYLMHIKNEEKQVERLLTIKVGYAPNSVAAPQVSFLKTVPSF